MAWKNSKGLYKKDVGSPWGGGGLKWAKIAHLFYAKTADMGEGGVKKWGKIDDVFYGWPFTLCHTPLKITIKDYLF